MSVNFSDACAGCNKIFASAEKKAIFRDKVYHLDPCLRKAKAKAEREDEAIEAEIRGYTQ